VRIRSISKSERNGYNGGKNEDMQENKSEDMSLNASESKEECIVRRRQRAKATV